MEKNKLISVVVPVYNEELVIAQFYERLSSVLSNQNYRYEVIFVDDGCTDQTLKKMKEISQSNNNSKIITFSRNFGHMVAISAGLDYAIGQAVITMDADLQHPPELIPQLLKKWEDGADVVNTLRKEAKNTSVFKKITAIFFYWIINKIGKVKLRSNTADFRLLDRKVVSSLKNMKEHSRFLRGLISWLGYKQEFVKYQADSRFAGKTKYSFFRMSSFAIEGITSFSALPLRLATCFGIIIAFFSFVYIIYAIYMKFVGQAITGWASVFVAVLFIGGIQLIFLGIIGEYLSRVYEETKGRPLYIVKEKIGF